MSLLTSLNTTAQNHKFLLKMEKQYQRASFYNNNYSEPPHLLQKANENAEASQQLIRESMQEFLNKLKGIISESHNNRIDYYFILSEMKNTDFFSEVALIMNQQMMARNLKLQKQNLKIKQDLKKALQRIRDIQRDQPKNQKDKDDIWKFNGIKTISENLYEKAKTYSQSEFVELCNKAILGEKVIIKKISDVESSQKWEQSKDDKYEFKDRIKKLDSFLTNRNKSLADDQSKKMLFELKQILQNHKTSFQCKNPCCIQASTLYSLRPSKAFQLRRSSDSRKPQNIYKNDRSQEYFNRYYRKSEFDMHKITSIEKTKMQQMDKLQDQYRVNLKQRKRSFNPQVK